MGEACAHACIHIPTSMASPCRTPLGIHLEIEPGQQAFSIDVKALAEQDESGRAKGSGNGCLCRSLYHSTERQLFNLC